MGAPIMGDPYSAFIKILPSCMETRRFTASMLT